MAQSQFTLLSNSTNKTCPTLSTSETSCVSWAIQCLASSITSSDQNNTSLSAKYFQPSIWDCDYIQSLTSDFMESSYAEESDRLEEEVRVMLLKLENPIDQLELIDILQRLGVDHHFGQEISNILESVYKKGKDTLKRNNNLYVTALEFRLLRRHGYDVSSDVFKGFLDYKGNFHSGISDDIKGMLSLYEASFHSMEDETILDEARDFSSTYLKEFVHQNKEDNETSLLVNHALELPLNWRISRLEARWFINAYEGRQNMSPALLKLAKLDFNILQAKYQEDLKHVSRWWKRLGLGERFSFARDRMVESFVWTVAFAVAPRSGYYRRVGAKVNAIATVIDDIYDIYGELEELEVFTQFIDRWDINAIDSLPEYMKLCFFALYNFVNEVAFDVLKDNGHNVIPHLKKAWADLCKSHLVEAKWYRNGYQPSLHEYLENGWISIAGSVVFVNAFFVLSNSSLLDLVSFEEYFGIVRSTSTFFRLVNDLGTSEREKETGDIAKSVECYMIETGASETDARRHINFLIFEAWKKMNKEARNSPDFKSFIDFTLNMGRMTLCMYQYGDAHNVQDLETKNNIMSILFLPIV